MVKILSDSTCDLSRELIEKYGINILPLHILLGEDDYKDGENITVDEIYAWAEANDKTPKTAALSPDEAMNALELLLENGDEVICFSISSSMSGTFTVMNLAADSLEVTDRVYCIDSQNLSSGTGLMVLEAAEMAQAGKTAKEIVEHIETLRPLVRSSFVVDTLTYLHRGGRCSGVAAMAGGMLKLHPRIAVEGGKMGAGKKYRGKMNKVILDYVHDMEEDLRKAKPQRVFITHSGCEQELLDSVHKYLQSLDVFDEIITVRAGSVISSHCGPGTLGVLYIAQE
jgi:DegV family protein with EDD domain